MGEIKPGWYTYSEEEMGAGAADVEQKRAEILDEMRTSKCFTTSILDSNGGVLHSSFILGLKDEEDRHDAVTFLSYASLKLINDLSKVLGVEMEQTLGLLEEMVQNGAGEDW